MFPKRANLPRTANTSRKELHTQARIDKERTTPVGSCHQFCHDTQPGPTASGGGVNALSSWALRFGPVDQEDGTVLRGSRCGHLQAGSPLGDRRWRGLLVKALGT